MVAVFLVTLYEYSPLFYIGSVFLCFFVTAAMVLGWIGFDVNAILRNSDEAESVLPTPEKQMVRVPNPFTLELSSKPASVTEGAWVRVFCLESSVLSCFWGCDTALVQSVLQKLQHSPGPGPLLQSLALHCLSSQTFQVKTTNWTEFFTKVDTEQTDGKRITDFGPLPRRCYPLVALLSLAQEAVDRQNIVSSVTVIHIPDGRYSLSQRILFQYLFTAQGNMYELKPLFMSTESEDRAESSVGSGENTEEQDSEWRERDCVVCQNATVTKVLLPCRHTCVCERCGQLLQHCPVCRGFIMEAFTLTQDIAS
ncbi:unnamed protein product [Knipowitschia caucasica]|uniref:RING-type domain-containing protein n=1 Tax=Knipowitschia caucasica TaxID=637954 RepID=A0AAV2K8Y3_KNICA